MKRLGLFFLILVFLTGLVWILIVPIWHFPDEQAHFGQVAYIAATGKNPGPDNPNLTEEIYVSEVLLGTVRDKFGNNKFTFNPNYRIEYADTYVGKYEASIAALAKTDAKGIFVRTESSRYALPYYLVGAFLYRLSYYSNLFTRVFIVRFWSIFLFLGTILITYRLGKLIFSKDEVSTSVLTILVGFQPMMVFANVGVTSDALANFIFTLWLFLSARVIIENFNIKNVIYLMFITTLAIYLKTQFIVVLPSFFILLFFIIIRQYFRRNNLLVVVSLLFTGLLFFYVFIYLLSSYTGIFFQFLGNVNIYSLFKFSWEYTIPHTIREVLPWYWGIYDWLGVTYPRIVHRIINRIIFVSSLGLLLCIYKLVKNKMWRERRTQAIIFLTFISLLYFIAISFYDWMSWYTQKYQLGVQGRYFFPVISIHMLLLLIGWRALFPQKWRLKLWGTLLLGLLMIFLNLYGLYTVAKTYYDLSSLSTFIIQASQYKPWFLKGIYLCILILIYFMTITVFLIKYILYVTSEKRNLSFRCDSRIRE